MSGNNLLKKDSVSKDEVDFVRHNSKDSTTTVSPGAFQCSVLNNKKRVTGTLYGDCEIKTNLKSSLSSLEKFSLFRSNSRRKSESVSSPKEKPKFVKSASIARLLGNSYSTKRPENEKNCNDCVNNSKSDCNGVKKGGSSMCINNNTSNSNGGGGECKKLNSTRPFESVDHFKKCSKFEDVLNEVSVKELTTDDDLSAKALRTISRGLGKLWWKRTHSVQISAPDPEFKVSYLGNVLTSWAKGDGCVEKPLSSLWRNYTQNHKPDIVMRVRVCASGLKATTRQHGLTEYWAHRITHCCAPKNYPRIFCWVYRHEGRKLKHEMRCHAVLCSKESIAQTICNTLRENLDRALRDFKREKMSKQNARLSLANAVYENPSLPRRKILLSVGGNNYRPPLERSKSAPKLMAIEEAIGEEGDEDEEETNEPEMAACCQKDSLYPAMTLGRRRCRRGHSIRRTGKSIFSMPLIRGSETKERSQVDKAAKHNRSQSTTEIEECELPENQNNYSSDSSPISEEDEIEKLLSRNDYDVNSPLATELLSYFDMKFPSLSGSLTNLDDLNIVYDPSLVSDIENGPRAALSLDNLDNYSDAEDEGGYDEDDNESDDTYYRQSAVLNLLHRESLRNSEAVDSLKVASGVNQLFDSDEGSISSGCETASTVTASVEDSSLKYIQQRQQSEPADILVTSGGLAVNVNSKNEIPSNGRQTIVSFKLPTANGNHHLIQNDRRNNRTDDGEVSDSEFSDESGYVEFQDNILLRHKSVAV